MQEPNVSLLWTKTSILVVTVHGCCLQCNTALLTACSVPIALAAMQLEYINGEVWANVWQTECIARIDPSTGKVRYLLVTLYDHKLLQSHVGAVPGRV
jgi:glutamine cyclotransferase